MENEVGLVGLRRAFRSGKTRGIDWRTGQLRAFLKLIAENEARIFEAPKQDLGKHPAEAYSDEIGVVKKSADHTLLHLKKWMAPKRDQLPLLLFPSKAQVLPEPLGPYSYLGHGIFRSASRPRSRSHTRSFDRGYISWKHCTSQAFGASSSLLFSTFSNDPFILGH